MALPPEVTQAKIKRRSKAAPASSPSPRPSGPPLFPHKVPVRPGAPTPRGPGRASTQAERTHVHEARVARNQELATARAQHDIISDADLHAADLETLSKHYEKTHGHANLAVIQARPVFGKAGQLADINLANEAKKFTSTPFSRTLKETLGNAAQEAVDIPLNAPAAIQYTVEHPIETAKQTAHQYSEIYHHPGRTFVKNPLATTLALLPAGKAADLAIGRVGSAEVLGRTGVVNEVAGRGLRGRKPTVTKPMVEGAVRKRVDETMAASYATDANPWQAFASEFSAKTYPGSKVHATKDMFDTKSEANVRANAETKATGIEHTVFDVATPDGGMKHVAVPKAAVTQFERHMKLNPGDLSKPEKLLTGFGTQFRRTVLSTSPKWLAGNVIEATLRSMVSGSGLIDRHVASQAIRRLEHTDPGAAAQLKARTIAGGHYHMTATGASVGGRISDIPKGAGKIATGHPVEGLKQMWKGYNHFVFDAVNGRIESQFQTAMLGQALRKNKLIGRGTLHLSNKALDEATRGLKNTNTQVQLGRQIDRMYGRYGKFSPGEKKLINRYTPFLRWYMNSARFLGQVLPADHPVLTAVLANANEASAEWRKETGQKIGSGTPQYLQGSVKLKGGLLRAGRYAPIGILQSEHGIAESFADTILPQYTTLIHNAHLQDWKGDQLKGDTNYGPFAAIFFSALEQEAPFGRQAIEATGIRTPSTSESTTIAGSVQGRLKKELPWNLVAPKKASQGKRGSKLFTPPAGNSGFFGGNSGSSNFFGP